MENQFVVFTLANEQYGVSIAAVSEVIKPPPITRLPQSPDFVRGVAKLRSAVLPVIDLRERFGLPDNPITQDNRIVVVEIAGTSVGVLVDAVSEVLRVPPDDIEPPSPLVMTADSAFITGIAQVGERLIILLDLGQVLSGQEKADLADFAPAARAQTDEPFER